MYSAKLAIVSEPGANLDSLLKKLDQIGLDDHQVIAPQGGFVNEISTFDPSLIILLEGKSQDLLFDRLSEIHAYTFSQLFLPIAIIQESHVKLDRELLSELGARDFFKHDMDPDDLAIRLRTLLEARYLHYSLRRANEFLEEKVKTRTAELEEARLDIVNRLAIATNFRDDITGSHVLRVGHISKVIAVELGFTLAEAEELDVATRLHDIGKIAVPDSILEKPSSLTTEEYDLMKEHTLTGSSILAGSTNQLIQLAEEIARTHHERWDGRGYPNGLAAEDIPLSGRICAVADVFDSLTSQRHYKSAWSVEAALAEIERNSGTQFDPTVVAAFCRVFHREDDPLLLAA